MAGGGSGGGGSGLSQLSALEGTSTATAASGDAVVAAANAAAANALSCATGTALVDSLGASAGLLSISKTIARFCTCLIVQFLSKLKLDTSTASHKRQVSALSALLHWVGFCYLCWCTIVPMKWALERFSNFA